MSYYKLADGTVTEIANPDMNPQLTQGATLLQGNNLAEARNSITSSSLAPTTALNFQQPAQTPAPNIQGIDTTTQNTANTLSPAEQNISDLTKKTAEAQNALLGKSAYTTQQENAQGIDQLTHTQNDIVSQINALKTQQQDLQNQAQNVIPNQIQQEFQGRGATAGGIAPIQASRLRENAIQQGNIASQALTLQASLYATQGKLASAQMLVDRAVQAKYGPLEEQVKTALANLDILSKDPALTLAQQKRLEAQRQIQKQKEADIAQQKQNSTDIWNVSVQASANQADFTPTQQYPTFAVANQAIQKAVTKEEALQIASLTGLAGGKTKTTQIIEVNGRKLLIDASTGKTIKDLGSSTTAGETRDTTASQLLESKKGTDGLVSASDYQNALRTYISHGGTQANFIASFPQQTYLRQEEINKLPAGLQIKGLGALSEPDKTKGVNYLLTNGGTQDDLAKFQTDRAFQAWVLSKIQQ